MDSLALAFLIERWGNISFGFEDMDKNNKSLFQVNSLRDEYVSYGSVETQF